MISTDPDLTTLGDELEVAVARDLVARHHHPRKRAVVGAIGAAAVLGATAAAAAASGVFDSDDVERGMPNGATMFQGTSPDCTEVEDGVVYRCFVPGGPQQIESSASYQAVRCPEGSDGAPADCYAIGGPKRAEPIANYEGYIAVLSSEDLVVSGGCVGQDRAGTEWLCYVGQRSVDEGLIGQDFLGTRQLAPGGIG
jgi:hypothetical protein